MAESQKSSERRDLAAMAGIEVFIGLGALGIDLAQNGKLDWSIGLTAVTLGLAVRNAILAVAPND